MTQLRVGQAPVVFGETDLFLTGVSDIKFIEGPFGTVIYAVTPGGGSAGGSGGISAWQSSGAGQWGRYDFAVLPGTVQPGLPSELFTLETAGSAALAISGVNGTGLWSYQLDGTGHIPGVGSVPATAALPADLAQIHTQPVGAQSYVYASRLGQAQIEIWTLGSAGQLSNHRTVTVTGTAGTAVGPEGIVAIRGAVAGGQPLLVVAADGPDALLIYRLSSGGLPQLVARVPVADGIGIATPTALEVVDLGGRVYAVLAGAGSSSISVFEIGADGQPHVTDHVIDGLATRFANITRLSAVTFGEAVFIVASGGDDGISLFQLLPGGRLLHQMTLEDTDTLGLADISALDMHVVDDALMIAVASGSEAGVSLFNIEPGPQGVLRQGSTASGTLTGTGLDDVLSGGAGDELLIGGNGDDILRDGAGRDTLTGGSGADVFVLDSDGTRDEITDFEPGKDRIDLSGWAFLRSNAQLTLYEFPGGIDIAFGTEFLRVRTATNTPLAVETVRGYDFLDLDRLLPGWFDLVQETEAGKTGGAGADTLTGGMAHDWLNGAGGSDRLLGAGGDDTLDGGSGADYLNGGPGSDFFLVDDLGDRVVESPRWAGHDHVSASVDFWMRRAHIEDLTLTGTDDIRGIGNGLSNVITGNSGNNILDGGKNVDVLIGGPGNDSYYLRAPGDTAIEAPGEGTDVIYAFRSLLMPENVERMYLQTTVALNGIGNDAANLIVGNMADNQLIGRGGRDTLKGLGGSDTFVFDRAPGNNNVDRIIDFAPGEDQLWIKAGLFGLTPGEVTRDMLQYGKLARDADDRILYDAGTGGLWIDTDGTGPERQMLIFVLEGHVTLLETDVLLY